MFSVVRCWYRVGPALFDDVRLLLTWEGCYILLFTRHNVNGIVVIIKIKTTANCIIAFIMWLYVFTVKENDIG